MILVKYLSTRELEARLQTMRRLSARKHWAYDLNTHLAIREELDRRKGGKAS